MPLNLCACYEMTVVRSLYGGGVAIRYVLPGYTVLGSQFSVAGPMAWNSLPDFIRDPTSSTDCFRRLLKTCLLARY